MYLDLWAINWIVKQCLSLGEPYFILNLYDFIPSIQELDL